MTSSCPDANGLTTIESRLPTPSTGRTPFLLRIPSVAPPSFSQGEPGDTLARSSFEPPSNRIGVYCLVTPHSEPEPVPLTDHPTGGYRFLPGIAPYSCGVVSAPGFEIAHVTLDRPIPYRQGFDLIRAHLATADRPLTSLCGVELRSPRPFTFDGFAEFNASYAQILDQWGVFVGKVNPVARTNVAPEVDSPAEPSLYGFSYARPCEDSLPPTFVVAGAGELPEGVLQADAIVRRGETGPEAIAEKARFVMDLMEARLRGLGASWDQVTAVDLYTIHPVAPLLPKILLGRIGPASIHGVRWFYTRPPIEEVEYEMDLRGVRTELRIGPLA